MEPPQQPRFVKLPPLALYVHVPWCVRKCPYCDFNSHEARGEVPDHAYVDALLADLDFALSVGSDHVQRAESNRALRAIPECTPGVSPDGGSGVGPDRVLPSLRERGIASVFIGGGTPSLLSAAALDRLLSGIRDRMRVAPQAEITLEANPGTFERERFAGYRAAGVTRLSLGIQSFDDRKLAALGRIHDSEQAKAAVVSAMALFDEVNLDLMYALPAQTIAEAEADVAAALGFSPPHLSFYQLTLEPNTRFHRHPPPLPDDDAAADIEDTVHAALAAAGYRRYETSAFARPGHECRHNLNYWQFGDYLGIGAGAHSKLSVRGDPGVRADPGQPAGNQGSGAVSKASVGDRIVRQMRWKQPAAYLDAVNRGDPIQQQHEVTSGDIGFEFMLNALRLIDGVPAASFAERTGYPLSLIQRELDVAVKRGLLDADLTMLRPTPLGRRFLNELQGLFLREATG